MYFTIQFHPNMDTFGWNLIVKYASKRRPIEPSRTLFIVLYVLFVVLFMSRWWRLQYIAVSKSVQKCSGVIYLRYQQQFYVVAFIVFVVSFNILTVKMVHPRVVFYFILRYLILYLCSLLVHTG